jgi:hypothetical protein
MSLSQINTIDNDTPPPMPPSEQFLDPTFRPTRHSDTSEAYHIVEEILLITEQLASLPDLKPCPRVNCLFGRLVEICIKPWSKRISKEVLESKRVRAVVKRLREMCAEGEGELERFWAAKILEEVVIGEDRDRRHLLANGRKKKGKLKYYKKARKSRR